MRRKELFIKAVLIFAFFCMAGVDAFAERDYKVDIMRVRLAAESLKEVKPELSAALSAYADAAEKTALERKEAKAQNAYSSGDIDPDTTKGQLISSVKLFTEAAEALQPVNSDLAGDLTKLANRKLKWLDKKFR